MRVRVSFECGAGVCLWADDAAARARWTSAVEFEEVELPAPLAAQGRSLMARLDRAQGEDTGAFAIVWTESEWAAFHADAARWTEQVAAALALAGIGVAPYGTEPPPGPVGEEFEGGVVACFEDETTRAAADRKEFASSGWGAVAVWNGDVLKLRAAERTPAELLAKLEREPGFVAGWWQASDGGGSAMLEGDAQDHALACLGARNATGLANFLSWLRVQRVHLNDALAGEAWVPTAQHRLADARGTWWDWFQFTRNATAALKGGKVSDRYLRAERERLLWQWTHGGGRAGWPANFGEALGRIGLKREAFNRWAR